MSMSPLQNETYVDQLSSNILVANMQPDSVFVHDRVFATVNVPLPTGLYFSMPDDAWFRSGAQETGPDAEAPTVEYHVNPDNRYQCKVVRVKVNLSAETISTYQAPLDPQRDASRLLARNIKIKKELDFNRQYFQPGVWTGFRGAANVVQDFDCSQAYSKGQWNLASSDPILDIQYCQDFMMSRTGYKPNVLLLSKDVWSALKNHPTIIERFKYTQAGILTTQLIAAALDVDEIVVAEAVLNSAQEGQAKVMGFMSKNCALLCYRTKSPAILEPSAAYQFAWTGYPGANGLTGVVTQYWKPEIRSTVMEACSSYDFKVVSSDFGVFLSNVLSNPGY